MPEELDRQAILDHEHLKLLSWGYYVMAGLTALYSLFAILGLVLMGLTLMPLLGKAQSAANAGHAPPAFLIWIIGAAGLVATLAVLALAVLKFLTGRNLARRKSRTFCMVIAAISCLEFPYGTLIGVLTFMVLGRDSVVRMFAPRAGA